MTEDEAQEWLLATFGENAFRKLNVLVDLVLAEARLQNLIAPSTIETIWNRHVADSAQLLRLVPANTLNGRWLDIGTGAGFPGLVIACLRNGPIRLVEPRRKRAVFLREAAQMLELQYVAVEHIPVSALSGRFEIISARAVASLSTLFQLAAERAYNDTVWVLPKGRAAQKELAEARSTWHGVFHVEHSVTDKDAQIVIASGVSRK